ncbi:MAG: rhodanese-like domain-containing protein [Chitinophagaceae bacterium]
MRKNAFLLILLFAVRVVTAQNNYKEVSLLQLAQKAQQGGKGYIILDVRTPGEYMDTTNSGRHAGIGRINTAVNVSLQDLLGKPETIHQLDKYKNEDIYVICSHSYRSRRISNLLLENGFTSVNNVKGGMTEWYRNYEELQPYMAGMYQNNIAYHNIAPSELFKKLAAKEPVELIGLNSPPRFFFDSLVAPYYPYFPDIKEANYYRPADSLQVLEKVKASNGRPVVLFSKVGGGAQDMSEWLARKGYTNIYNLVNSLPGFYEYVVNFQSREAGKKVLVYNSNIQFYTPLSFCKEAPKNVQWIDLRHDTTFNQVTEGTKINYKTLNGAVNFPFYKTADAFTQQFPDKNKLYMILPQDGYTGIELADALLKKGYRIGWIIGGIERWEWYTNNIDAFTCGDQLIQ